MLKHLKHQDMGKSNRGWLQSLFHFSFAEYINRSNMQFGVLRVLNDDIIQPQTGFHTHPHRDMEIISYVIHGELSHRDSMGHHATLKRGEVQYMSAGTGVYHSEHNHGETPLRLVQIWILPDHHGHTPAYGDHRFPWSERHNRWLEIVSGKDGDAPVKINQNISIKVITLDQNQKITLPITEERQSYLVQLEGESEINTLQLQERDALEITGEPVTIQAITDSHIMVIEMPRTL